MAWRRCVNESYKRLHEQDVETDDLALTRREDNYVSELDGLTKYGTSIIALEDEIYKDCSDQPERALKLIKALQKNQLRTKLNFI